MNEIGIMQGRLVPRIDGRIQAFPWKAWPEEFATAADIGFDSIEFIFEGPDIQSHPLMSASGQASIRKHVGATGVKVSSVCADYFMGQPLFHRDVAHREQSFAVLMDLIRGTESVGARKIEIPCVDQSSIKTAEEGDLMVQALERALPLARRHDVELLLETDLAPQPFADLLGRLGDARIGANYDTGNSASLGYDSVEEIRAYGSRILNIHIKDRVLGGTTVPLGSGNADFPAFFEALRDIGYREPFILQTARDPDDVGVARRYFEQVREWVSEYLAPGRVRA